MKFCEAFDIQPGLTAVIGSGGKSTLLNILAEELAPASVILCTTTHMFPAPGMPALLTDREDELSAALAAHRAVCLGTMQEDGKLCVPAIPVERLTALADYVLVEADGSKRLPLKAHASYEPVIPAGANQTICVVGLSGLGRPIPETVHRPELFCALTGAAQDAPATPQLVAAALNAEGLADCYYLNQADSAAQDTQARELAKLLRAPVFWGSLHRRKIQCL